MTESRPETVGGSPLAPIFLGRGWPQRIVLFGYFVPVFVGVCVRTYLQHIGKPVVEWSWIFEPPRIVQFLLFLAYWDAPFFWSRRWPAANRCRTVQID